MSTSEARATVAAHEEEGVDPLALTTLDDSHLETNVGVLNHEGVT